jgi:hypothetical protein
MCADASGKCIILDNIMDQYMADIGHDALLNLEWHAVNGVLTFLRVPHKSWRASQPIISQRFDLVPMSVSLLLKHYDDNEQELHEIDRKLTMVEMKASSRSTRAS